MENSGFSLSRLALVTMVTASFFVPSGTVFAVANDLKIEIANQTTSAVTDYQVPLTINTASLIAASKMKNDCSDFVIKDTDGTTLLNYYLEPSTCATSATKIWVKLNLQASPWVKTITLSSGSGTNFLATYNKPELIFDFFDDFSTNNIGTKWAINDSTWPLSTKLPNSDVGIDVNVGQAQFGGGAWNALFTATSPSTIIPFNRTTSYGRIAEGRTKFPAVPYFSMIVYSEPSATAISYNYNSYVSFIGADGAKIRYAYSDGIDDSSAPDKSMSVQANTWYIQRLTLSPVNAANQHSVRSSLLNEGGTELSYTQKNEQYFSTFPGSDPYLNMAFGLDNFGSSWSYFDWFRVRKSLTVEPIVTVDISGDSGSTGSVNTCEKAFGYQTLAKSFCSFVVGRFNFSDPAESLTAWIDTDTLFVIGNGISDALRKNAFTVLKNGNVGIGVDKPTNKFEVLGNVKVNGNIVSDGDICIGKCL